MQFLYLIFIFFFLSIKINCFENLKELQQYTKKHKEFAKADNNDPMNPYYTSYHQSITPYIWERILQKIHILDPIWSPDYFVSLLEHVTSERKKNNLIQKNIIHLYIPEHGKLFIWGNIHASLHSLARSLSWLRKEKIITNDFKLTQPHYYLFFNGNAIDNGLYNFETLTVLLLLMKKNPNQVFYLQGNHEAKKNWKNFNLQNEISTRYYVATNKQKQLEQILTEFFETLPQECYINSEKKSSYYIRISPFEIKKHEIDLGELFNTNSPYIVQYYNTSDISIQHGTSPIDIRAIIKINQNFYKEFSIANGLGLHGQEFGAETWEILSAPLPFYQKYYNFFNDAFAVVNIENDLLKSTITLYHHDIRSDKSALNKVKFIKNNPYFLCFGTYTTDHILLPEQEIILGSSMSFISGVPFMGKNTHIGMNISTNQHNAQNTQTHIRSIVYNDNYTPYLARKNIINFVNEDINTILLPVGSPTLAAYLDLVREKKVLVLFPITGGPQFRSKELPNLLHLRATYADEVYALIDHLITEYGTRSFAFFYQNDAYGIGPFEAAQKKLKEKNITQWAAVPYLRASTNFKEQIDIILEAQPDAIGLFSTAHATQELIRQIGIDALANKKLFGISFLGEKSFRIFTQEHGLDILLGAVVPNPKISNLEIVKEYRQEMDNNNLLYDVFSLEGYIATQILLDIIKKIPGTITNDAIKKEIQKLNNYSFKGLTLTYNPERNDLSQPVWLETGDTNEWVQKDIQSIIAQEKVVKSSPQQEEVQQK